MTTTKKLAKISLIYLLGQLGSKFISLIMLPIYTSKLSTQAYGNFDVITAVMSIVIPFFCIEVWSGMLRFALIAKEENEKRAIVNNSLIICFVGTIIISIGIAVYSLFTKLDNIGYLYAYMVTTVLMYITTISCRAYGKNSLFAASGIASVLSNALASIICIFVFHLGIETLYIAAIVSNLTQILMVELKLKVISKFKLNSYDQSIIKKLFRFCLPLSINSVFSFLLANVNRIIINYALPNADEANGIYAVANKLAVFITLLLSVFFMAWQETNYSEENSEKRHAQCKLTYKYFVNLIGCGVVIMLPVTKIIFPFMVKGNFVSAYNLVPFIYMATYFQAISNFTSSFFSIENKTSKLILSKIVGSVINIAVIFSLIFSIGLVASPIALIASQLAVMIVQYMQYKKFLDVGFRVKDISVITILFFISSVVFLKCSLLVNLIVGMIMGIISLFICKEPIGILFKKIVGGIKRNEK